VTPAADDEVEAPDAAMPEATADGDAPGAVQPYRLAGEPRWPMLLAVGLALVLAATSVVLGVLLARGDSDPSREVRAAAGRFGEALLTYDYQDPEANRDAVLALSTGSFRSDYDDAFADGLAELITQVEARSRAIVKDVFVSEVERGTAQAIVLLDLESDGAGGPRTIPDVYFQLGLVRVEGTWLVDQVINLNLSNQPGAGAPDGAPAPVP
jgi:Mce-associated membrane protein